LKSDHFSSSDKSSEPVNYLDKIYLKDCRKMIELPDECVKLIVTSPPYNVTKTYDQNLTLNEYLSFIQEVLTDCKRVLSSKGLIALNIANLGRKPYIPLDVYMIKILQKLGFHIVQEIIWNKEASAGGSCAWGSWLSSSNPSLRDVHEYIILASKKADFQDFTISQDKHDKISLIVEGKKITFQFNNLCSNIWNFQTESAKRVKHPAPFPVELPYRFIHFLTNEEDLILDPFMGSGTTAIAAIISKRHYVGYDISKEFVETAEYRINNLKNSIKTGSI
jgi:DNA modification methylase